MTSKSPRIHQTENLSNQEYYPSKFRTKPTTVYINSLKSKVRQDAQEPINLKALGNNDKKIIRIGSL